MMGTVAKFAVCVILDAVLGFYEAYCWLTGKAELEVTTQCVCHFCGKPLDHQDSTVVCVLCPDCRLIAT